MRSIIKRQHPLWAEFPTLLDDMLNEWNTGSMMKNDIPAVNVKETDQAFVLHMAVPGLKKDDFKVELNNDVLTISKETKSESESHEGKYSRKEFNYSSFKRSFTLPKDAVDADKIDAQYIDGILSLNIPKKEVAKVNPIRMINIG